LNDVVLASVMFSLLGLVYMLVARETVGFTLGEALLDVRYHPPWRGPGGRSMPNLGRADRLDP
jgi:hypothetical protein